MKQFDPTEEQIAAVLRLTSSDPRKLAISYLRAQHRAQQTDTAFKLMDGVAQMATGLAVHDSGMIKGGVDKFNKTARTMKQSKEKSS